MRLSAYNPGVLDRDDVVLGFIARHAVLQRIVEDLARDRPQHRILVGQRGMGKSTLLRRLYFAITEDAALQARWTPLAFREEQYNLKSLADFWLNCLEALDESLRPATAGTRYTTTLEREIERVKDLSSPQIEREAWRALEREIGASKRGLCLLVDNVDLLFERLSEDELWKLREVLSSGVLVLIGTSVVSHPATYEYKAPFYDFFRSEPLTGLDDQETRDVLSLLSELRNTPEVVTAMTRDPGRISTLRVLSGGNPRAIVLVHQLLSRREDHNVVDDVTALLDMCTPLYKARFEALSPQGQLIADAMSRAWDPVTAARVAKDTRLDVNVVSSQLNRLVHDGFVEQVKYPGARKGFQIAERLFNVWYLMRVGNRARRKLVWLVEFLRAFYGPAYVAAKAGELAKTGGAHEADLLLAYASAAEDRFTQRALELRALEAIVAKARKPRSELENALDFKGVDRHLVSTAERLAMKKEICQSLGSAEPLQDGTSIADAVLGLTNCSMSDRHALALEIANPTSSKSAREKLTTLSQSNSLDEGPLSRALKAGWIELWPMALDDVEAIRDRDLEAFDAAVSFASITADNLDRVNRLEPLLLASKDGNAWLFWLSKAEEHGGLQFVASFFQRLPVGSLPSDSIVLSILMSKRYLCSSFWIANRILEEKLESSAFVLLEIGEPIDGALNNDWVPAVLLSIGFTPWSSIRQCLVEHPQWDEYQIRWLARFAARGNHAPQAVELMDELGLSDTHRPIREALLAAAHGPDHLLTVAPEVREPALKILKWITFDPSAFRASSPPEPVAAGRAKGPKPKRSRRKPIGTAR